MKMWMWLCIERGRWNEEDRKKYYMAKKMLREAMAMDQKAWKVVVKVNSCRDG